MALNQTRSRKHSKFKICGGVPKLLLKLNKRIYETVKFRFKNFTPKLFNQKEYLSDLELIGNKC